MLLGVLLALAAGTIVIYIVSQATGTSVTNVTVLVAKQQLNSGTVLVVSNPDATHMLITDAFTTESIPSAAVPANALPYVSPDDLNVKLNNQVVVGTFYQGDILRTSDPRLVPLGTGSSGSLTTVNPSLLKDGDVLFGVDLQTSGAKIAYVPGDHVDIIVTVCNLQGSHDATGCESQTTFQDLYVYSVSGSQIIVVVQRQQAQELLYLKQVATSSEVVIRKPGDDTHYQTTPSDSGTLIKDFNF